MIRVASGQLGVLYDAEARLSALVPNPMEGSDPVRVVDLPLLRPTIPVLALSWTVMHAIDATSPLASVPIDELGRSGIRFFLMMRAEDATLGTTIHDLRTFEALQIRVGARYASVLTVAEDGHLVLDLDRLGLIEPETG